MMLCNLVFFFVFRLFPSVVVTADFPSPVVPILSILFRHFNISHVLFHHIHTPPFHVSSFLAVPPSASLSQYTYHISSVHVQTTSVLPLVFSLQTVPPVPGMFSFLILSILVTPNENRNIFNSDISVVLSCLLLFRTLHYSVQSCSCILNPPLSPPLLLAFSLTVSVTCLSFTHTCILSFSYLTFIALLSEEYLQLNVICKHHGPRSFLADLTRLPIHHHCKQTTAQNQSLVQSHFTLNPSVTPTAHLKHTM